MNRPTAGSGDYRSSPRMLSRMLCRTLLGAALICVCAASAQAIGFFWSGTARFHGEITESGFYTYNSSGAANTVRRNSKGVYTATFPGLGEL